MAQERKVVEAEAEAQECGRRGEVPVIENGAEMVGGYLVSIEGFIGLAEVRVYTSHSKVMKVVQRSRWPL